MVKTGLKEKNTNCFHGLEPVTNSLFTHTPEILYIAFLFSREENYFVRDGKISRADQLFTGD